MRSSIEDRQLDRILVEAVSAFRQLKRPTRAELERLDALALPLLEHATTATRKLVAITLAEAVCLPSGLAAGLALDASAEVAAPILSSVHPLAESTLAEVVATRGEAHSRALLARADLPGEIREHAERAVLQTESPVQPTEPAGEAAAMRDGLRAIMAGASLSAMNTATSGALPSGGDTLVSSMLDAAFRDARNDMAAFAAGELGIDLRTAERAFNRVDYRAALVLLKAIGLGMTDCFAILSLAFPAIVQRRETMALFYLRYDKITDADIEAATADRPGERKRA